MIYVSAALTNLGNITKDLQEGTNDVEHRRWLHSVWTDDHYKLHEI